MEVKLYIGNLQFETTDQDLQNPFVSEGMVISAKVMADRFTGRSRGFAFVGLLNISIPWHLHALGEIDISSRREWSPSSKAAALLARGTYSQYVSTAKGRERRWRLFSTFPLWKCPFQKKLNKRPTSYTEWILEEEFWWSTKLVRLKKNGHSGQDSPMHIKPNPHTNLFLKIHS